MSDSDSPPRSPFAPLLVSYGESVGFSGSQNPGSRPRDHRSQVPCRSQGSLSRNGAQHTCGLPHLSLHGFGLPRTTSEVFDTSHRDGVQTIQTCRQTGALVASAQCRFPWEELWLQRAITEATQQVHRDVLGRGLQQDACRRCPGTHLVSLRCRYRSPDAHCWDSCLQAVIGDSGWLTSRRLF